MNQAYRLLAGLYVSQYLGIGFFYTGLAAILRERGVPLTQLAVIQLIGLLWAAKALWAPLLDRYGGGYRRWLLVLQPAVAAALLLLLPLDPVADLDTLLLVATLVIFLSATQDIAADALAVRVLRPEQRGLGNGIQIAGGYLGSILGGGATLLVYDRYGWSAAVVLLAVLAVLPAYQIWHFREPAPAAHSGAPPGFRSLVTVFRQPGVARWVLGLLPLYWTGATASYALVTPMLVDAGWSVASVGVLNSVGGGATGIVGALASGALVRRLGRRGVLQLCGGLLIAALLALLPLAAGDRGVLTASAAVLALHLGYGAASAIASTVHMDLSRGATAGADFTLLSSTLFVASLVSGGVALGVAGKTGYPAVVAGSAVVVGLGMAAIQLWFVDRSQVASPAPAQLAVEPA